MKTVKHYIATALILGSFATNAFAGEPVKKETKETSFVKRHKTTIITCATLVTTVVVGYFGWKYAGSAKELYTKLFSKSCAAKTEQPKQENKQEVKPVEKPKTEDKKTEVKTEPKKDGLVEQVKNTAKTVVEKVKTNTQNLYDKTKEAVTDLYKKTDDHLNTEEVSKTLDNTIQCLA